MNPMTPEELERFIHQNLRSLPPRRAPRSLEARVLAALEQQAMIPWYHRSWSHWPAAVRAGFLVVAVGVAGVALGGSYVGISGLDTGTLTAKAGEHLGIFGQLYHLAVWFADFGSQAVSRIPALWLYGGIAAIAGLYATFFGLGAVAYRTLYRNN